MNQDIGIFDTITDDYILSGVKMELDLTSSTTQDFYLLNKINEGLGALRNTYTLIPAVAILPINKDTLSAELPRGYNKTRGKNPIRMLLNNAGRPNPVLSPVGSLDGFFKGDLAYGLTAQIVDGYIWFGSTLSNDNIIPDTCELSYTSTNIDANGNLKIPALAYRPLYAYACSEYLHKIGDNRYQKWDKRWRDGKRWLRGVMAEPDSIEAQTLGYINNHMPTYGNIGYWTY